MNENLFSDFMKFSIFANCRKNIESGKNWGFEIERSEADCAVHGRWICCASIFGEFDVELFYILVKILKLCLLNNNFQ